MPASQRAKQFMPFAAVKGLEKAIIQQDQLLNREDQMELGEEQVQEINMVLNRIKRGTAVFVRFYKDGKHQTMQGKVQRFDFIRSVISINGEAIPIEKISDIRLIRYNL